MSTWAEAPWDRRGWERCPGEGEAVDTSCLALGMCVCARVSPTPHAWTLRFGTKVSEVSVVHRHCLVLGFHGFFPRLTRICQAINTSLPGILLSVPWPLPSEGPVVKPLWHRDDRLSFPCDISFCFKSKPKNSHKPNTKRTYTGKASSRIAPPVLCDLAAGCTNSLGWPGDAQVCWGCLQLCALIPFAFGLHEGGAHGGCVLAFDPVQNKWCWSDRPLEETSH